MAGDVMSLDMVIAWGFDLSRKDATGDLITVRCSQCAAVCVNGCPVHETGCPNRMKECNGCNELVPFGVKYCEDCR
jgi:hypothetical protein